MAWYGMHMTTASIENKAPQDGRDFVAYKMMHPHVPTSAIRCAPERGVESALEESEEGHSHSMSWCSRAGNAATEVLFESVAPARDKFGACNC